MAALDYSLVEHDEDSRLEEIEAISFDDYSRALYGRLDYGNELTLFVQEGNLLIRVSAASPEGDPTSTATSVMESILSKAV